MPAIYDVFTPRALRYNVAKTSGEVYDISVTVNYVKLCILMTDLDRRRTLEKFGEFEKARSANQATILPVRPNPRWRPAG